MADLIGDIHGHAGALRQLLAKPGYASHAGVYRHPDTYLRPHNESNSRQHAETMRQVPAGDLSSYLDWFRTLPMWLDLGGLRVVHACWDKTCMAKIDGPVTDAFLQAACVPGGSLFGPVESLLKGKERLSPRACRSATKTASSATPRA